MTNQLEMPEFSRPVVVEDIGPEGLDLQIAADPFEREAVRKRLDLLSLDELTGELHLAVSPTGISVKISGHYRAQLSQECVVSLEPVKTDLDEALEAEFGPSADETEILLGVDEPDPVEPLVDGRIDLGELIVQNLAMALDPYPRKDGAQLLDWQQLYEKTGTISEDNPFSVLAALRKKDE